MKHPWEDPRCILCCTVPERPLTDEHVIPQQLGGELYATFLCKPCNDRLGSDVEPRAKEDPAIRLAIEHLRERFDPALARKLRDGQVFVGDHGGERMKGRLKGGEFRVDPQIGSDGCLVQPATRTPATIRNVLRKRGVDEAAVAEALQAFEDAPEEEIVRLAGVDVVKRRGSAIEPALDGESLSPLVLLKIAYELLAFHLRGGIYTDDQNLAALRAQLRNRVIDPELVHIEELTSREYEPHHALLFYGEPHVEVRIILFDILRFHVHLRHIALPPPYFFYVQRLAPCRPEDREDAQLVDQMPPRGRVVA